MVIVSQAERTVEFCAAKTQTCLKIGGVDSNYLIAREADTAERVGKFGAGIGFDLLDFYVIDLHVLFSHLTLF
jgi:hypothetical protein